MVEEASNIDGGHSLPEDVIVEILSWLPVKILLRFKCICKSWYNIISGNNSDNFVSKHLRNYYNNKANDRLLIQYLRDAEYLNAFFHDPNLVNLDHHSLEVLSPMTRFLGPCNGIYYLRTYALWNPALKECKMLPVPLLPPRKSRLSPDLVVYELTPGFGIDPSSGVYKVVIIRRLRLTSTYQYYSSHVLVYNASDDDWINVDFPWRYGVVESYSYMFLNGAYYWIAFEEDDFDNLFVLSFDMKDNSFHRMISAPTFADGSLMPMHDGFGAELVLHHESIGWVQVNEDFFLHLWVITLDNNSVAWTKKVTIGPPLLNVTRPLGYWKNGQLILLTNNHPHLYDLDGDVQDVKDLGILSFSIYSIVYKESFVSIGGEKYIPGEIPLSWQERFNAIELEQSWMEVISIYEQDRFPWYQRGIGM